MDTTQELLDSIIALRGNAGTDTWDVEPSPGLDDVFNVIARCENDRFKEYITFGMTEAQANYLATAHNALPAIYREATDAIDEAARLDERADDLVVELLDRDTEADRVLTRISSALDLIDELREDVSGTDLIGRLDEIAKALSPEEPEWAS